MTVGERIKARRKDLGLSADKLAELVGVNRATVYRYEGDEIKNMGTDTLVPLAKALRTTPAWLMGWDGDDEPQSAAQPVPLAQETHARGVRIPVFGTVRAGIPLDAVEDILDYEEIPRELADAGEYFGLRVKGDSMLPDLKEGDVVIVRQQPDVNNGDTAIVLINGDEATVKRVTKSSAGLTLIPANSLYAPMFFSMLDVATMPVKILGKVIEIRRRL